MTNRRCNDNGFSIVEVLAGLAVAALVLTALTNFFFFVASAQRRSIEAETIIGILLDTQALANEIEEIGTTLESASISGLTLRGLNDPALKIGILLDDDRKLTVSNNNKNGSILDLSIFDDAKIEYFINSGTAYRWDQINNDTVGQEVLAQLVLIKGQRVWHVVFWSQLSVLRPASYLNKKIDVVACCV